MAIGESTEVKSLQALIGGSFPAILSKLSSTSVAIPANKDFHFLGHFDEFKKPVDEIVGSLQCALETIAGSALVCDNWMRSPGDADEDDAYDWLVNANDEFLERMDTSMDSEKWKKNGIDGSRINVNKYGKAKVPFHKPTIKKPQEEYNIWVNNANTPFEHFLLETSEESGQYIHPLEKLSVMDFVDTNLTEINPVKPLSLEGTPFKLVNEVNDLKDLAVKLHSVEEFAVDLEHNQYRSFQGLTCLMQISTRTEDYVVDTFKLWDHIGPYLREFFKDPKRKKVMHGADRDIIWLQRDFGIYVCNLFDTGQASRVLKLERYSLEYLLKHFCGVAANKQYQNADWRIRPLPDVMTRYAREDTHYLLYIYDVMRIELYKMAKGDEQSDSPLIEVYARSYDVCMQLYEKELLTGNSYLHLYGVHAANFNAVQLSIVSGLFEWRDVIARADDESTGYVLPNKTLLEIAKEMPISVSKLRRLLKSKNPYIERNIDAFVSVIRRSMQNAAAFESVVRYSKGWCPQTDFEKNIESTVEETNTEAVASSLSLKKFSQVEGNIGGVSTTCLFGSAKAKEEAKVSMSKRDEVIIVSDDDEDDGSEEGTSETDDKVSETPCKTSVLMTQKQKTCDLEVIVIDDNDSDEESEDEGMSRKREEQVKYMSLKRGFLNI